MRKILILFFCMLFACIALSQNSCDKNASKVSYTGKAPFTIDGQINDWQSILGPVGNYQDAYGSFPYQPPYSSAFNWALDRAATTENDRIIFKDRDVATAAADLHFLAFTHDDYNVYFYLRRQAISTDPATFYYFIDLNDNGLMNNGEPVIHATFTNNSISSLTLSRYVVNATQTIINGSQTYDVLQNGNYMQNLSGVDNFPLTGTLTEVFNANNILSREKLKHNELFAAAITEDGYGVELAIPWDYLKNWTVVKEKGSAQETKYDNTKALEPGDIFFYHVSMQPDAGPYYWPSVVDHAGSCGNGLGVSGNLSLSKNLTSKVIAAGSEYHFSLSYSNQTNASTIVETNGIMSFEKITNLPLSQNDFTLALGYDDNCNGILDPGEKTSPLIITSFFYNPTTNSYEFRFTALGGIFQIVAPYSTTCLLTKVILPANGGVKDFKVRFNIAADFRVGQDPSCPDCGPKPINQVGFVEQVIIGDEAMLTTQKSLGSELLGKEDNEKLKQTVSVYPNPSIGAVNIILPTMADVIVEDVSGQTIQVIRKAKPGQVQLRNLRPGFYLLKIAPLNRERQIVKKVVVQ